MREIKFRAKDYQTNKWVYGFLFMGKGDDNRDYAFILKDKGLKVGTATEDNAIEFPCDEAHLVDKETICQYTGLKDKNGKEIYEGDLIRSFDSNDDAILHYIVWEEARFVALYKGRYFRSKCYLNQDWLDEFDKEVIGNIYDDPKLVEG